MKKRPQLNIRILYRGRKVQFERTHRVCIICGKPIWHYYRVEYDLRIPVYKNMFFCKRCWNKEEHFDVDEEFTYMTDGTEFHEDDYAEEKIH